MHLVPLRNIFNKLKRTLGLICNQLHRSYDVDKRGGFHDPYDEEHAINGESNFT
jgi:hypothetical protein